MNTNFIVVYFALIDSLRLELLYSAVIKFVHIKKVVIKEYLFMLNIFQNCHYLGRGENKNVFILVILGSV